MHKTTFLPLLAAAFLATSPMGIWAEEPAKPAETTEAAAAAPAYQPETDDQKISYIIGTQIGEGLRVNGITIDFDAFQKGMTAAYADAPLAFTPEQVEAIMTEFQTKMRDKQMAEMQKEATDNLAEAVKFLDENKAKEGVVTTESGLQYQIITAGEGECPTDESTVTVHYRGTFLDGEEFDSSYKRNQPAEFGVTQVIKGWTEGLKLMKPGSKYKFWIHPDLAYGESGRPSIPPNSLLQFEVELIAVKAAEPMKPQLAVPQ